MTFYLKPPRGIIHLHNLEECVKHRLACYEKLRNGQDISEECSRYLIEDSPFDRTGHYIFRLAASCVSDFKDTFFIGEEELFRRRLESLNSYEDLKHFLMKIKCQAADCNMNMENEGKLAHYFITLKKICLQMLRKTYLLHILNSDHEYYCNLCTSYIIQVPFQFCFSLLEEREVILHHGIVLITCNNWKKILCSLFHTYLAFILKEIKNQYNLEMILQDERISNVINLIETHYQPYDATTKSSFNTDKIDDESKLFPLCMQNLYEVLKRTNRLSHNARFNFSLYLKGIGVSMSDSIRFWKQIYSKQHMSCSKCTHNWQESEKRYIYGIRHLYGLEGARKNYSVRTCSYFQNTSLTAIEDGGCPFRHFGEENLRAILKKCLPNQPDKIEIIIYERNENPSDACKIFYESIYYMSDSDNKLSGGKINFLDPVQYYLLLNKALQD